MVSRQPRTYKSQQSHPTGPENLPINRTLGLRGQRTREETQHKGIKYLSNKDIHKNQHLASKIQMTKCQYKGNLAPS